MRFHYVVSYDIRDPKRLRAVHRIVRDFGDRLQYSVFTCQLGEKDLAVLRARLHDAIHHGEDQVVFFNLGRVTDESDDTPPRSSSMGLPLRERPEAQTCWVF
jgi:CRISPR-associated protein Cas2